MNKFDIDDCLKSMQIIVDTREQPSKRAERRYESFSAPYKRQTLSYGDYTYNFQLPDAPEEPTVKQIMSYHLLKKHK